mmetsp:Transcript_35718/g.77938  ORF Transcript_35718/g.77938 Transcript_35718/m.77938 type:complete len:253 (+) Transcript_35718:157-915(+)
MEIWRHIRRKFQMADVKRHKGDIGSCNMSGTRLQQDPNIASRYVVEVIAYGSDRDRNGVVGRARQQKLDRYLPQHGVRSPCKSGEVKSRIIKQASLHPAVRCWMELALILWDQTVHRHRRLRKKAHRSAQGRPRVGDEIRNCHGIRQETIDSVECLDELNFSTIRCLRLRRLREDTLQRPQRCVLEQSCKRRVPGREGGIALGHVDVPRQGRLLQPIQITTSSPKQRQGTFVGIDLLTYLFGPAEIELREIP